MTNQKKVIYLIAGLGSDGSIYKKIKFPEEYEIKHINWVKPKKKEELDHYAIRLTKQIDLKDDITLIGLSFGGLVAIELAKIISVNKTVLISSIKTEKEKSSEMLLASWMKPNRFIPSILAIKFDFWYKWVFGELSGEEVDWITGMTLNIDPDLTDWAIDKALKWKNNFIPENIVHLHGDKDNVFPIEYISNCRVIKGGTHFMIGNRSEEISIILSEELLNKDINVSSKHKTIA